MACRAAVFASARPCHQLINRNDIIPTPSQPMNSCSRLLAVVKMIMVIKNISRYLMNRFRLGSECIYHTEYSMIDHETYRATGMKMVEKKSNFRLSHSLTGPMESHCQSVTMNSVPELKKEDRGIRLMKNAHLIHDVT